MRRVYAIKRLRVYGSPMETVDFLLARPFALLVVLAIGAAIGMGVERMSTATMLQSVRTIGVGAKTPLTTLR